MNKESISKSFIEDMIRSRDFCCFFQPIFDVHKTEAIGFEALVRSGDSAISFSPADLFEQAFKYNLLVDLELCCRDLAIEKFVALELSGLLFLNASPLALEQPSHNAIGFHSLLERYGLSPKNIVVEITEQYIANSPENLSASMQAYRELGFQIAIDDLGSGHSGLMKWVEIKPNIVKIDRYFISNCQNNMVKRELLRTIFDLGKNMDVSVIAEGIEHEEEFITLRKLGMKYAQGYLLGKPNKEPNRELPKVLKNTALQKVSKSEFSQFELAKLVLDVSPIFASESCKSVYHLFKESKQLKSLAVVNECSVPVGMIYRDELSDLLSSHYGHALYDKQPIAVLMKTAHLTVDIEYKLDDVSKFITNNQEFDLHPEFIITSNGKYIGLANVRSILKLMTEKKIMHAQQANPLTMLPGNIVIENNINERIKRKDAFELAYFDLDHFKPFNDVYGYAAGDQVIKLVAEILLENSLGNFIGHVGGDDYVAIYPQGMATACCQKVLDVFNKRIKNYFELEHVAQQGYYAIDRNGQYQLIPLLGLSCGIIKPHVEHIHNIHDVSLMASKAKKYAKRTEQGKVFVLENSVENA